MSIADRMTALADEMREAAEEVRWLESMADGFTPPPNGPVVQTSGHPDPTERAMGTQAAVRYTLKAAERWATEGRAGLDALRGQVRWLTRRGPNPVDQEPIVSQAEVEEARQYQTLRTARGDGYGAS